MKPPTIIQTCVAICALTAASLADAQDVTPTTGIDWPVLGKVAPRSAKEIASSWWSIGGETLDRDFAVYENYKAYVGALGATRIRVQAGWAKCEKKPGIYDFGWLDAVVDDARAQGVQPWLELSYGNTIYPGGGGVSLGGGFPSSPEAIAAWDRWVTAIVRRYKDRVFEWEIWNESDGNRSGTATAEGYVALHIRTAAIIRAEQPRGRILALGLAGNVAYGEAVLSQLQQRGKLDLVDVITIHGYPRNPDDISGVERLLAFVAKLGHRIEVRQGETGAPSKYQENFALSKITWSETTQAKWDLRRLLAHRAKDVPMNLFTMSDLHYTMASNQGGADGALRMNYKGMLATNSDQTVAYAKPIYYAAQTVFSIFADALSRLADYPFTTTALRGVSLAGYQHEGAQVVALWFSDAPPAEANGVSPAEITLKHGKFSEPVLVDVRTSMVYALPPGSWTQGAGGTVFHALPIYDSPILIAEKSVLSITPGSR